MVVVVVAYTWLLSNLSQRGKGQCVWVCYLTLITKVNTFGVCCGCNAHRLNSKDWQVGQENQQSGKKEREMKQPVVVVVVKWSLPQHKAMCHTRFDVRARVCKSSKSVVHIVNHYHWPPTSLPPSSNSPIFGQWEQVRTGHWPIRILW